MLRPRVSLSLSVILAAFVLAVVLSAAGSVGAQPLPEWLSSDLSPSATLAATSQLTVAISAEPDTLDPALTFDGGAKRSRCRVTISGALKDRSGIGRSAGSASVHQPLAQAHAAHRIAHPVVGAHKAAHLLIDHAAADHDGE